MNHPNNENLLVVKTGRTIEEINKAVDNGYKVLMEKVNPNPIIKSKYAIVRNKETGHFKKLTDFRTLMFASDQEEIVIEFTFYYPYQFQNPYAAYLIPKDLQIGQKVLLEDLIEDVPGTIWNQGDTYRLSSCEAIWNGENFDINYDFRINCNEIIG